MYKNNFEFLRIFASCAVLFSHHYALTGTQEPDVFGIYSIGSIAVFVFFSISGFLVTESWRRNPNILIFLRKRILRIWPALIFVTLVTVFFIGPVFTSLTLNEYFYSGETYEYFKNILLDIRYYLPGVFLENPYPKAINGSLWIIPFEFKFYLILSILGLVCVLKKNRCIYLFLGYMVYYMFKVNPDVIGHVRHSRELFAYFSFACLLNIYKEYLYDLRLLFSIVLVSVFLYFYGYRYLAFICFIPYFTIYFGSLNTRFFNGFGRFGDPSYGIYLYAFPTQQVVVNLFYSELGFLNTLVISYVVTIFFAYASWHFLEKYFLKFK